MHARTISDDWLINAVHRWLVEAVFVAYALVLVYMSFVPFDFTRTPHWGTAEREFLGLGRGPLSLPDILANLALYVPLGVLGFTAGRRRGWGRLSSTAVSLMFAAGLSFLVEQGQRWVIVRVSTWADVTANTLGCFVGIMLAGLAERQVRWVLSRARWAAPRNWWLTLGKAAVCVVLVVQLRPYDVVDDVFHTAINTVRHADVSPLARWQGLDEAVARDVKVGLRRGMYELPRAQCEYALDQAASVAAYAAIVVLIAVGLAPRFASRGLLYLWAGFVVTSLAAMVTGIRIFLISYGLDTAHFFSSVAAWPIGCAIAHGILRHDASLRGTSGGTAGGPQAPDHPDRVASRRAVSAGPWPALAVALVLMTCLAYELVPFDFGTADPRANLPAADRRICLVPMMAHFHARPNIAFFDLSGDLVRYSALGACLALILRRKTSWPWRRQLAATFVAVPAVATAMETAHLFMATRQTDTTTLILAAVGAFGGAVAVRWVYDFRASVMTQEVEDLLTTQLIEGETFKPLPEVRRTIKEAGAAGDERER